MRTAKQERSQEPAPAVMTESSDEMRAKRRPSRFRVAWIIADYLFDTFLEIVQGNTAIVRREIQLFLGSALVIIGFFGFESGKYCDGNTADYLSCTRPSTYYFYDTLDIVCLILGVSLILLWFLKRR